MVVAVGLMAIEAKIAGVTLTISVPLTPLNVAVTKLLPTLAPVTSPCAIVVLAEPDVQVADAVRSWVLPSLYSPVAFNCTVVPLAIDGVAGVTVMVLSVAAVTVRRVEPLTPLRVAEIVEVPTLSAETIPVAAMVAVTEVSEFQVAVLVKSWVLPSE